jgi:hypothetical protein
VLPDSKTHLACVYAPFVPTPNVTKHLRTQSKVEQAFISQSTVQQDCSYVVPTPMTMDGLTLTPFAIGTVSETKAKFGFHHFGFTSQWQAFKTDVKSAQFFLYNDSTLLKEFLFVPGSVLLTLTMCGWNFETLRQWAVGRDADGVTHVTSA